MKKFNFNKLLGNCNKVYCYQNTKKETFIKNIYENNQYITQFLKTFCKEENLTLKEALSYFIDITDENLDFNTIEENVNSVEYMTCCDECCLSECIFKNIIETPFLLGYKETANNISSNAYPTDKFPELLKNYITQLAEAMVAPPQYVGTALLALLSALCSRFAYLQATPTWKIPLTGYYLIVGDVSTKKTPTISEVLSLLNGHISKDDRILANDSTIEALEQLLFKYKSILLHADESGTMDTLGGYTKTNQASTSKILSLYTCKPYRVDRKGQEPVFIEEPKLSILAGIQPGVLKQSHNLMRTGMLQRFIIAYAERSKDYCGFSLNNVNSEIKQDISNFIIALYEMGQEENKTKLTLSEGALKSLELLQEELYNDIDNSDNDALRDYYGKYKEHVLKIAGLFHIVKNFTENTKAREISKETFEMAMAVTDYYLGISKNLFNEISTDKPMDTEKGYKELLKKCKNGVFNPTFLNASGIGGCDSRKKGYTDSFIERLLEQNRCIELFHHGGKGRKFLLIKE